jgi:hypothetical protein
MAILGLKEAVISIEELVDATSGIITVPNEFLTPGFWAVLAAYAWRKHILPDQIRVHEKHRDYLSAIGFAHALGQEDGYPFERKNKGINYSTLVHLDRPESTDSATSAINGCVRNFVGSEIPAVFVKMLCDVVGDLHANVWAHGKASGFSMAQKWKTSWNPLSNSYSLEFALADSGIGFLREVQNAGLDIHTDQDAIDWCIQEGNSTKKVRPVSDWAQRVPADVINNPLRGIEQTRDTDNHHMGLGLFKLVRFVREFRGFLWLVSGSSGLVLAPGQAPAYIYIKQPWQGVAIACRFQSSDIATVREDIERGDKDIQEIMRILGGNHG